MENEGATKLVDYFGISMSALMEVVNGNGEPRSIKEIRLGGLPNTKRARQVCEEAEGMRDRVKMEILFAGNIH